MMAGIFLLPLALAEQRSVTWYSEPIHLRPSEVHNRVGTPIRLPPSLSRDFANSSIAVRSFTVDVVTVDGGNGEERSVPLHEAYNHHYIVFAGSKHGIEQLYNHTAADGFDPLGGTCEKPPSNELLSMRTHKAHRAGFTQFGGASGAEFRNNPHDYPEPYTYIIPTPEHALVLLHLINQQPLADGAAHADAEASRGPPYFECPCTPQRDFDLAAGTIDGCYPRPPFECTDALRAQRNSGCSLEQYYGGYRCCEHGVFLADTAKHDVRRGPVSTYMLKFTLNYRAHLPAHDRPLHPTACCDVTEGMRTPSSRRFGGNVEYDIPQCAKGTPTEQCVHVATSVHPVDWTGPEDKHDPNEIIELVHAVGHLHVGALHIDLIDELTGQLICRSVPTYGSSKAAGDEEGYLTGIQPCVWGPPPLPPPPRFKRSHPVRTIAHYNSTKPHAGVMSLWLMSAAVVASPAAASI